MATFVYCLVSLIRLAAALLVLAGLGAVMFAGMLLLLYDFRNTDSLLGVIVAGFAGFIGGFVIDRALWPIERRMRTERRRRSRTPHGFDVIVREPPLPPG